MAANIPWKIKPDRLKENLEKLNPILIHKKSIMTNGTRHMTANTVETIAGGIGSLCLNKCLISGFLEYKLALRFC